MTYQQTVDYLFQKLPMFSRMGSAAFKKDLTNIKALCHHLGNPHKGFPSIHIAGTNGKGSVSHMLAVLQTAGYKTGLYTSPHLYDFRERIKINGAMVPEDFVVQFVEEIKPLIEKIEPSFFEITVAMAFRYFTEQKVDIAVIEVGLGGRLDSTNIITPELSIITNISLDHTNMLGNTLAEIAAEKGGIIKSKVPAIIGETTSETEPVFSNMAAQAVTPIFFADKEPSVGEKALTLEALNLTLKLDSGDVKTAVDLPGLYQEKNVNTVLHAIAYLRKRGWQITEEHILTALTSVKKLTGLFGRWEVLRKHPHLILEVAHNEGGIKQVTEHLERVRHSYEQLHIVMGMVKDKDIESFLTLLPKEANYYFTQADILRALPAIDLQNAAQQADLNGAIYDDVNKALDQALSNAKQHDLILVCGSIFLVAEVDKSRFQ